VERLFERAHRLYGQERGKPEGSPRLGAYMEWFAAWACGGLPARRTPQTLLTACNRLDEIQAGAALG
jgi:hypothetical protein